MAGCGIEECMSWEGKSLVKSGRTKGVSSNPKTFFHPGSKGGEPLQLSLQLPGNDGWEYGLRDAMSIMENETCT